MEKSREKELVQMIHSSQERGPLYIRPRVAKMGNNAMAD
jgi:hypothetical protein